MAAQIARISSIKQWARQRWSIVAAVTVGVVIGGVGPALVRAAIPDTSGVIHACYGTGVANRGKTKIIDSPSQSCANNEAAITWNQAGNGTGPGAGFVSSLVGADLTSASLPYRNFSNMDLHTANFTRATLTGSDFHGANLTGAQISGGKTSKANFQNVNFTNATFNAAFTGNPEDPMYDEMTLANTNLAGANFTGASFKGFLDGGSYVGATFANVKIGGQIAHANFHNVDFRTIVVDQTALSPGFVDSDLSGANFSGYHFAGTNPFFIIGNLTGANLSNTQLRKVYFSDISVMAGTNFTNAHFDGAILANVNMTQATITGATWTNTTCPDATNSNNNGNTCVGHLVPLP